MPNIIEATINEIDKRVLFFRQLKPKLKKLVQRLIKKSKTRKKCPRCHSEKIATIVRGFINPSAYYEGDNEKFIYQPGCIVYPFSPVYHCRKCGKEWGIDYGDVELYIDIIEKYLESYENLKKLTFAEMQELYKNLVSLEDELIKYSIYIEELRKIMDE